jgi:integrase
MWLSKTIHGGRRDAEAALHGLLAAKGERRLVLPSRVTLGEFLRRWLADYGTTLRPTTLDSYREIVGVHLVPALGGTRLDRLTPGAVQGYLTQKLHGKKGGDDKWEEPPLSPMTVRKHVAVLHKALASAMQWNLLAANVCDRVSKPRPVRYEAQTWDSEQVRLFLAEARRSSPYHVLYLTALLTGARQGELLGLRWPDVDFTLGTTTVRQTFYRRGSRQMWGEPKSKQSRRTIALPPVLLEELRRLHASQENHRRLLGVGCADLGEHGPLVFAQPDGKPLHGHNLTMRDFHRVIKKAGLPRIRFHDLRHAHATLLLAQGENLRLISERLGHHAAAFTLSTYAHVLPGMQEAAVARLEARLFGPRVIEGGAAVADEPDRRPRFFKGRDD